MPGAAAFDDIHASIAHYYTRKAVRHGATPAGVDWLCGASQQLRYAQLLTIADSNAAFSLNDLGCGYGAALPALAKFHPGAAVDYLGVDLCDEMVRLATTLWGGRFVVAAVSPRVADYSIASGIFNVKLEHSTARWERLIASTLDDLAATSRLGFAVNLLGPDRSGIPQLYRTPPEPWIRYCEQFGSTRLLSGYGLGEFTLCVSAPGGR